MLVRVLKFRPDDPRGEMGETQEVAVHVAPRVVVAYRRDGVDEYPEIRIGLCNADGSYQYDVLEGGRTRQRIYSYRANTHTFLIES